MNPDLPNGVPDQPSRPSSAPSQSESEPARPENRRFIDLTVSRPPLEFRWAGAILHDEWQLYCAAIEAVRSAGIPFLLGGGFALAAFTGKWRDTKDIDFYIRHDDRDAAVAALRQTGFEDYYKVLPYDRNWILRNHRDDVIVDLIWSMANQRAQVDDLWFQRAVPLTIRSQSLLVVPPEEFIWCKLYILQRDHCDWTDVFNLLYAHGTEINWDHLIGRLEEDTPLLKAMLLAYGWLCPTQVTRLPSNLWEKLEMPPPKVPSGPPKHNRIRLLDSREWFAGVLPEDRQLAV